jgi:hypothetical protein
MRKDGWHPTWDTTRVARTPPDALKLCEFAMEEMDLVSVAFIDGQDDTT